MEKIRWIGIAVGLLTVMLVMTPQVGHTTPIVITAPFGLKDTIALRIENLSVPQVGKLFRVDFVFGTVEEFFGETFDFPSGSQAKDAVNAIVDAFNAHEPVPDFVLGGIVPGGPPFSSGFRIPFGFAPGFEFGTGSRELVVTSWHGESFTKQPIGGPFGEWTCCPGNFVTINAPSIPVTFAKFTPIPEPSTLLLFGTGLAGLGLWRWKTTISLP